MTDQIVRKTNQLPSNPPENHSLELQAQREVAEVQSQVVLAKRFPRDVFDALKRISTNCSRLSFAESALYTYPRGGQTVQGASIRLAEMLAQCFGNIQSGIRELESTATHTKVECFAWDLESNLRVNRIFTVEHRVMTRNGPKTLTDPRDIYDHVYSFAARRLRGCILQIIPGDVVEEAVEMCKATIKKGVAEAPIIDTVKRMMLSLEKIGVNREMIEGYLKHPLELTTADEVADLRGIYKSIQDGVGKREDFFKLQPVTKIQSLGAQKIEALLDK